MQKKTKMLAQVRHFLQLFAWNSVIGVLTSPTANILDNKYKKLPQKLIQNEPQLPIKTQCLNC